MISKYLINYYMDKAFTCFTHFQNRNAIKHVDKVLFFDKDNVEALLYKGLFHASLFEKSHAMSCFDEALKIKPNSLEIFFQRGVALYYLEEYQNALVCFNHVLSKGDDIESLGYVGQCYLFLDQFDEAYKYFFKALEQNPYNVKVLSNLSRYYLELKNPDLAFEYVEQALEIDPNDIQALSVKSDIFAYQKNYSQALNCQNQIFNISPNVMTKITRGSLLADLGQYEQSLNEFMEITILKFDDYNLIKEYYLYYGHALEKMGKYTEAISIYDEYLEKHNYFPADEIQEQKNKILNRMM